MAKNNKKSNMVNFLGETRRAYAILLPSGGRVLCRAGGLSTIISRKEANREGIEYLRPVRWAYSDLYLYPNGEVRDGKGHYWGQYLGHDDDDLSGEIIGGCDFGGVTHDVFVLREGQILRVSPFGESRRYSSEGMIQCRLHWTTCWNISGKSYPDAEDFLSVIRELAKANPVALKAALMLQQMQRYDERREEDSSMDDNDIISDGEEAPEEV